VQAVEVSSEIADAFDIVHFANTRLRILGALAMIPSTARSVMFKS